MVSNSLSFSKKILFQKNVKDFLYFLLSLSPSKPSLHLPLQTPNKAQKK